MNKFIYSEIKQELDNINRYLDACAADCAKDIPNLYSITGKITDYNTLLINRDDYLNLVTDKITDYNTLLINRNDYLDLVTGKIERVVGKTMRAEGTENNE